MDLRVPKIIRECRGMCKTFYFYLFFSLNLQFLCPLYFVIHIFDYTSHNNGFITELYSAPGTTLRASVLSVCSTPTAAVRAAVVTSTLQA